MGHREKKFLKILGALAPVLALAVWYGYGTLQEVEAKKAKRRELAQKQREEAEARKKQGNVVAPAAGAGAKALPSPPPGAKPADNHASAPPAASAFGGVHVAADVAAQVRRSGLPWGRDPFVPPDTQGPRISAPADLESPRGEKTVTIQVHVSDAATGNNGTGSVLLTYSADPNAGQSTVRGKEPGSRTGDGLWTFTLPAPTEKPFVCAVVATDKGRLQSVSRSNVFRIIPPPRDAVTAMTGGTNVKLVLRGISWAKTGSVALINNDVVALDEYIHGYQVVRIAKNAVVLKRGGNEIVLQLKE